MEHAIAKIINKTKLNLHKVKLSLCVLFRHFVGPLFFYCKFNNVDDGNARYE